MRETAPARDYEDYYDEWKVTGLRTEEADAEEMHAEDTMDYNDSDINDIKNYVKGSFGCLFLWASFLFCTFKT